jgi:ketosteroid isomerase-like protein
MSEARRQAVELAQHYFRLLAKNAGASWDDDNATEIEIMVSHIIDAAVERLRPQLDDAIKRIRQLENRDDFDGALDRIEALERQAGAS